MKNKFSSFFPGLKIKTNGLSAVYLDSACTALKNSFAIAAQKDYLEKFGVCSGKRAFYSAAIAAEEKLSHCRLNISKNLNCLPEELVFTSGATEGFNIAANSLDIKEGDEIFLTSLEHNSVFLPFWKTAKEKKAKIKIIPLKDFESDYEWFEKNINRKTKILCFNMASNLIGGITSWEKFVALAQSRGIVCVMDAAQFVPTHKLNVREIKADIICFSAHKLSAPFGTGIMYIKDKLLNRMLPSKVGGGTIESIKRGKASFEVDFLLGYGKFEAGIGNYSGIFALSRTFDFLNDFSFEEIRKRTESLVLYAKESISKVSGLSIIGKNHEKGSILTFSPEIKNFSPQDFQIFMSDYQGKSVAFRTGKMCCDLGFDALNLKKAIRLSFWPYNEEKDIEIFVKGLKDYCSEL